MAETDFPTELSELRSTLRRITDVIDVAALTKVLPRITTPALTEAELKTMDIVDLVQLGSALNGFLTPKKFKEIEA